jgi:ribosomal protein S27E
MEESRLDGNAAAGLLSEVFSADVTAAVVRCAGCGAEGAVATLMVYEHAPGTVLRCPGCQDVMMRIARIRGRLAVDPRGIGRMML